MAPSSSPIVAHIPPVFSLITMPHVRWSCIPCSMSRPFVRLVWAMGDVRAPSMELRRRFWTSILTKGGTWASAAEVRSQLSASQSNTCWTAQSIGADPSSGAAAATEGANAVPTKMHDKRSGRPPAPQQEWWWAVCGAGRIGASMGPSAQVVLHMAAQETTTYLDTLPRLRAQACPTLCFAARDWRTSTSS